MPYEVLPHTADWALRVRAADLPGLFAESARGMNFLSGIQLASGPRTPRTFETRGPDDESLLVAFLSELVYAVEQENLAFDEFVIQIEPGIIRVEMTGSSIRSIDKAIKAVTYHNLRIQPTRAAWKSKLYLMYNLLGHGDAVPQQAEGAPDDRHS